MALTNTELWNLARNASPTFASHTAKGTADFFTERGFDSISSTELGAMNEFFDTVMQIVLQKINVAKSKNIFADTGLVEVYNEPFGGYTQRMAIASLKPESAPYRKLENGKSVDMQKVRKPIVYDRFWKQNFDYYSHESLQDFQLKNIFTTEYGMSNFTAGIMIALQNGFKTQEMENTKAVINAILHDTKHPLKDTQKMKVTLSDDMTAEELVAMLLSVRILLDNASGVSETAAFNAGGFSSYFDPDETIMLVRNNVKDALAVKLIPSAFHQENLSLPVKTFGVTDFGGIEYYTDTTYGTQLYPYYDEDGVSDGLSTTKAAEGVTQTKYEGSYVTKDPNADVIGMIIQKGAIFENVQNPYRVLTAPFNAAGLYTTIHASRPNNTIAYDSFYNCIVLTKA